MGIIYEKIYDWVFIPMNRAEAIRDDPNFKARFNWKSVLRSSLIFSGFIILLDVVFPEKDDAPFLSLSNLAIVIQWVIFFSFFEGLVYLVEVYFVNKRKKQV